ncbi:hypothetical protein [Azospirillum canadense]|uniref:hypothetical protein n=1 Tax=Azospirillum canadense TaxID=403962 RepID=UPI00222694CF|nr:hypothetical protein [Azospirillum canadense]MCW2240664.1 hypothetical protein [Azospirillum canadense]
MPKSTFPDRIDFGTPLGTKARLYRVLGIDPSLLKSGQAGAGPRLRTWLVAWLDKAESSGAADPVVACENVAMLDVAASLLSDPDEEVRKRVICTIENCRDFQDRRRRKASGETVMKLDDLRMRPEDLRALVKNPGTQRQTKAAL